MPRVVEPWDLTWEEFVRYRVPSPMGDRSRSPGQVPTLRSESGSLYDYRRDPYAVRDWLGHGYDPRYDESRQLRAVIANAPLTIYRATDAERVIWPGAYVTLSKSYAYDHGIRNMGARRFHILRGTAHADELVAVNPQEFWYAPRDLYGWWQGMQSRRQRRRAPQRTR